MYVDLMGSRVLFTLGVSSLSFGMFMLVWKEIFDRRSFLPVEEALLTVLWILREEVRRGLPSK
jgi:hypothetical protein